MARLQKNTNIYDRNLNVAQVLKEEAKEKKEEGINSWDDFFKDVFPDPLLYPKNVSVYARRHLPVGHILNAYNFDLQIPIMFGMQDKNNVQWFAHTYDTLDGKGFQFCLTEPDPEVYLNFLQGKATMLELYKSADRKIYLITPDVSKTLLQVNFNNLPDTAMPSENSYFNSGYVIDPTDPIFGVNVENVEAIKNKAASGRFY